ncbi:hypothetical protein OsJ_06086 [Oryza sativa Japonica Group]|uniref:Uncharacterized protein n=1 Tax=Oryza sativa subsp. japonica TaxID=39947 RepID=B9F4T4_ORYSJ|nr:hypothetical protein OsJ_06086 [Oryza sativa Japonica Group]
MESAELEQRRRENLRRKLSGSGNTQGGAELAAAMTLGRPSVGYDPQEGELYNLLASKVKEELHGNCRSWGGWKCEHMSLGRRGRSEKIKSIRASTGHKLYCLLDLRLTFISPVIEEVQHFPVIEALVTFGRVWSMDPGYEDPAKCISFKLKVEEEFAEME